MRLGLLGLGRIGAFYAETLTRLPAVGLAGPERPGTGTGRRISRILVMITSVSSRFP